MGATREFKKQVNGQPSGLVGVDGCARPMNFVRPLIPSLFVFHRLMNKKRKLKVPNT